MFNKLFAVCLLVENFEKSLKFYKDTLGLKVKSQEGNQFAGFDLKGTEMAIFQKDGATAMFPKEHMGSGGGVVIGFNVRDLDKACEELKTKGVKIFEGPKTTPWGQKVAYFKDPDGNIWEVSEPFEE
ncbi:VOC family protein [Patescibacteria group bacterium]|nr:VOC family protein [Patescibacteria group bacterium]